MYDMNKKSSYMKIVTVLVNFITPPPLELKLLDPSEKKFYSERKQRFVERLPSKKCFFDFERGVIK